MINLKLEEVSEMVFRYMKDNQVDLLTAYKQVEDVIKNTNNFTYEQVKNYLFNNDMTLIYDEE
jgi:hypothetical protein